MNVCKSVIAVCKFQVNVLNFFPLYNKKRSSTIILYTGQLNFQPSFQFITFLNIKREKKKRKKNNFLTLKLNLANSLLFFTDRSFTRRRIDFWLAQSVVHTMLDGTAVIVVESVIVEFVQGRWEKMCLHTCGHASLYARHFVHATRLFVARIRLEITLFTRVVSSGGGVLSLVCNAQKSCVGYAITLRNSILHYILRATRRMFCRVPLKQLLNLYHFFFSFFFFCSNKNR